MASPLRWAFKLAYLGRSFHESARQPGLRTVEGELLKMLESGGVHHHGQGC